MLPRFVVLTSPDIDFLIVLFGVERFWRNPQRRVAVGARHCILVDALLPDLRRTEVSQFELAFGVEQDVFAFDVAMHTAVQMAVLQRQQQLSRQLDDDGLAEWLAQRHEQVGDAAASHQLHDDVECVTVANRSFDSDDVRVTEKLHHVDLTLRHSHLSSSACRGKHAARSTDERERL